jgi:rod shape determining protein RodA
MTVSALTRPGERDRLIVKLTEIDWLFVGAMTLIAGAGGLMLFSIAGPRGRHGRRSTWSATACA